jgi:kinesin family protein 1/kinesin family protein 3/17
MDINVKVAVRCRPMSSKEVARGCNNIVTILQNSVNIKGTESNQEDKTFTFDFAYDGSCTQQQVYGDLGAPIVSQALDGFNGTIFAYGQTGSGKTFSMLGNEEHKGIIPQLNDALWLKIAEKMQAAEDLVKDTKSKVNAKCLVTVSFLEVYNEEIKDLLVPSDKKLNIRESPDLGIYVEGLAELVSTVSLGFLQFR